MTSIKPKQSCCRFGIARADITPPIGMYHRMWGAAKHDRSTGVHRPLTATVTILQNAAAATSAESLQVIVAIDHCILEQHEVDGIKAAIETRANISPVAVVVLCSHTHAAGLMNRDRVDLPGGDLIPEYLDGVHATVGELADKAKQQIVDASIVYGTGHCDLAAHRDFWDEENELWVCGPNPDGTSDDTVLVARVMDEADRTLATIVNYACHPTTLAWDNTLVSTDYPGAMREVIEEATGAPCVFIQGAAGDLGPHEGFVGDTAVADRNGRQLGYAALSAIESLPRANHEYRYRGPVVSGATIGEWEYAEMSEKQFDAAATWRVQRERLPLRYRDSVPSLEQVEAEREQFIADEQAAREAGDDARAADCRAMVERRTRLRSWLKMLPPDVYPYRMFVWRIGDAVWIAVQGEPYNLFQRELRARFPDNPIIVATVADIWGASYLPPRELYGKGIYQESIALMEPGSLEKVIEYAAKQVQHVLTDEQ